MTPLARCYPGDAIMALAAIVAVQTTLVILAAALIAWRCRRAPAARHAIWLTSLGAVLLSLPLTLALQRSGLTTVALPLLPVAEEVAHKAALADHGAAQAGATESSARFATISAWRTRAAKLFSQRSTWQTLGALLALAWLGGTLWRALRLLYGEWALRRLRGALRPLPIDRWGDCAAEMRLLLGRRPLPLVGEAASVGSPFSFGLLRPVIALPAGLAARLTAGQLRDVLIHECAHAARRDHLVGLLEQLTQVLFWPQPLLPYLLHGLARSREELCDNYVLRTGEAPHYVRTLLAVSQDAARPRLLATELGMLDAWPDLEHRAAELLDARRARAVRTSLWVWTSAAALALTLAVVAGGVRLVARAPRPIAASPAGPPAAAEAMATAASQTGAARQANAASKQPPTAATAPQTLTSQAAYSPGAMHRSSAAEARSGRSTAPFAPAVPMAQRGQLSGRQHFDQASLMTAAASANDRARTETPASQSIAAPSAARLSTTLSAASPAAASQTVPPRSAGLSNLAQVVANNFANAKDDPERSPAAAAEAATSSDGQLLAADLDGPRWAAQPAVRVRPSGEAYLVDVHLLDNAVVSVECMPFRRQILPLGGVAFEHSAQSVNFDARAESSPRGQAVSLEIRVEPDLSASRVLLSCRVLGAESGVPAKVSEAWQIERRSWPLDAWQQLPAAGAADVQPATAVEKATDADWPHAVGLWLDRGFRSAAGRFNRLTDGWIGHDERGD